jgi:hypothetical protein
LRAHGPLARWVTARLGLSRPRVSRSAREADCKVPHPRPAGGRLGTAGRTASANHGAGTRRARRRHVSARLDGGFCLPCEQSAARREGSNLAPAASGTQPATAPRSPCPSGGERASGARAPPRTSHSPQARVRARRRDSPRPSWERSLKSPELRAPERSRRSQDRRCRSRRDGAVRARCLAWLILCRTDSHTPRGDRRR